MKKMFFMVIMSVIIFAFFTSSSGKSAEERIIKAEQEIAMAGTISVKYSKGMVIGSELLDAPIKAAMEKKEEYDGSEAAALKNLKTNIIVNLNGVRKKAEITIDEEIADYADFVDNIIINSNEIYCYIKPNEFDLNKISGGLVITINDEAGVAAKYSGSTVIWYIKVVLIAVFLISAIYMLMFRLLFTKKLKENLKKTLNIITPIIGTVSLVLAVCVFLTDFSPAAVKKLIEIKNPGLACFDIEFTADSSSSEIKGIQIGLPVFDISFNPYLAAVISQSSDSMKGDTLIGGKYSESTNILKFGAEQSGIYYIRNNTVAFDDVSSSDEGLYEAITVLASKGILNGKSDSIFGTEDSVTRAETVTMLCKMLNLTYDSSEEEKFEDVNNSDWYYSYALTARENNILSGYEDNTFRGQSIITRQEFASVLGQIMENKLGYVLPSDLSNLLDYEDSGDISAWAADYVSLLENYGINVWEEAYLPKQPITRGEAAVMLYRLYSICD